MSNAQIADAYIRLQGLSNLVRNAGVGNSIRVRHLGDHLGELSSMTLTTGSDNDDASWWELVD